MVAAVDLVEKGRQLSGPQEYFCRLVACEGKLQTQAYRRAFKCAPASAPELSSRLMAKPAVVARISELRAQADRDAIMGMNERRRLLAEKARLHLREKPTHGDQIRAIELDARMAGELRSDGTQISIGGDLNISVVLQSLRAAGQMPASALTRTAEVVDVTAHEAIPDERPDDGRAGGNVLPLAQSAVGDRTAAQIPPLTPLLGPLGRVRGSKATLVSPGRQMAVESSGVHQSGASAQVVSEPYVCEE